MHLLKPHMVMNRKNISVLFAENHIQIRYQIWMRTISNVRIRFIKNAQIQMPIMFVFIIISTTT